MTFPLTIVNFNHFFIQPAPIYYQTDSSSTNFMIKIAKEGLLIDQSKVRKDVKLIMSIFPNKDSIINKLLSYLLKSL